MLRLPEFLLDRFQVIHYVLKNAIFLIKGSNKAYLELMTRCVTGRKNLAGDVFYYTLVD